MRRSALLFIAPLLLAGCGPSMPARMIDAASGTPARPLGAPVAASCGLPANYDRLDVQMVGQQPVVKIGMDDAIATMVLDTGASETVVTSGMTARFNATAAQPAAQRVTQGIDGRTVIRRGFVATLHLGTATLHDVNLNVTPAVLRYAGQSRDGLLGLDLLGLFDLDLDLAGGRAKLYRGQVCPDTASPWPVPATELKARRATLDPILGAAQLPADRTVQRAAKLEVPVVVNGKIVWALLDTGATNSVVSMDTAAQVGVSAAALDADRSGVTQGSGGRGVKVYLHQFDTLRIAGESFANAKMLIGPLPGGTAMLLGADYLRNHRIWLSYATARVFVAKGPVGD